MAQKLKRLRIDRIAFVDEGANPGAHIALMKRKEAPMAEPTAAELAEKITKLEGDVATVTARAEAAEQALAKATEKPEGDDVLKGLAPEAVERFKALQKQNEEQAARIEKIEADRNREQMIRKCSEFKALGAAEDLTALLLPISKALPKPEYDALLTKLKGWNEQIRQSALFKEIGKSTGEEGATPEEQLTALAKAYQTTHATEDGLTYEIAYSRVLQTPEGKALYKALKAPQGGR